MSEQTLEELRARIEALERRNEELERLVTVDELTGLRNRRGFEEALAAETARAKRGKTPLAVLMMDGNGVKHINDTYGHEAGDRAIRHIADAIRACIRSIDTASRFGGDEFAVVLSKADAASADRVGERIVEYLRKNLMLLDDGTQVLVTVSIGGAATARSQEMGETLRLRADEILVKQVKPSSRQCGGCMVVQM